MGRPRKSVSLGLWMNGEYVGRWSVTARGEHELHYDPRWLDSPRGRPVSLSMPMRPAEVPYKGEVVRNYFQNLLPDNDTIRRRIAQRFHTSTDSFDLLTEIGRDCVGALQVLPDGEAAEEIQRSDATPVSDEEIGQHLARVAGSEPFRVEDEDEFRISLAGNQEKTAFLLADGQWCRPHGSTPTTHIFKLPLGITPAGIDLSTSVENEWLCMQLLRAFDVPCANVAIRQFGAQRVLCVERFDRRRSSAGGWLRLPQEDFAQIAGVAPERKYEEAGGPGIRQILDQLAGSSNSQADRSDFFRTQVLFWMLAAIDGHAKNFSVFLESRGEFRLTPRYDVLSAHPVMGSKAGQYSIQKVKMAMAVWGKNRHYRWAEIRRSHFEQTGSDCRIFDAAAIIDELAERTPRAIDDVKRALPEDFPQQLGDSIFTGLRRAARAMRI